MSQIKKGEWYVLDRTSTMSCVTFAQYADRMDAIARVFPVFFFQMCIRDSGMADRIIQVRSGRIVSNQVNEHPVPVEQIEW